MNKTLKHLVLASLLGAGSIATAHAGLLTYQGVTFTSSWSANVLTLEIDAANHTGDWAKAKGLAALELNGIGTYTGVRITAAPGGASGWTSSSSELNASGCSGDTNGQAGSRLCFFGQQIALTDNMTFSFAFSGSGIQAVDPHVKVEFVNAKGKKVGSLLSQTLPASPAGTAAGSSSGTSGAGANAGTGTAVVNGGVQSGGGATVPAAPVAASTTTSADPRPATGTEPAVTPPSTSTTVLMPLIDIAMHPAPSVDVGQTNQLAGMSAVPLETARDQISADVPEPQSIALLLGGLGLMGLVVRRKRRT